ncbi:hypothetical protein DFP73DRAFT_598577 [Morchella snyderi]|nr:hypothetical protein DFP73DRAFT_598577 [Morchella snyderi]
MHLTSPRILTSSNGIVRMSFKKKRGYIEFSPVASGSSRPLPVRLGGQPKRETPSMDESQLFGIPLDVWEEKIPVENEPILTVVCPAIDEADSVPLHETDSWDALRPLTKNLLGFSITDLSDDDVSDEEAEKEASMDTQDGQVTRRNDVEDGSELNMIISEDGGIIEEAVDDVGEAEQGMTVEEIEEAGEVEAEEAQSGDDDQEEISVIGPEGAIEGAARKYEPPHPDEITTDTASACDNPVVEDFHLALMMFTTTADISVKQYKALLEVLSLATESAIKTLPKSLKTLRERCRRTFPLATIKARPVVVNAEAIPPQTSNPRLAYYFRVSEYCNLWLSSPKIRKSLHLGMGEIVDNRSELWHGHAWMESIRSTSGRFATIREVPFSAPAPGGDIVEYEQIILPSDCVIFNLPEGGLAMGRVKCVGIDRREISPSAPGIQRNCPSLIVNRLIPTYLLGDGWQEAYNEHRFRRRGTHVGEYPTVKGTPLKELIMMDTLDIIPCSAVLRRIWVFFADYLEISQLKMSLLPEHPEYIVKAIGYTSGGGKLMRHVHKRHRVAAELELVELTRQYVLTNLTDYSKLHRSITVPPPEGHRLEEILVPEHALMSSHLERISLPFSLFLDGFGLYRNAYHSIKGMYVTPAGLSYRERERLFNLFVLMIGPFGANEQEMAACLRSDSVNIGGGCAMRLYSGELVLVTAFPLLFTGDMPQQNQNSGVKSHNAEYGCRSCLVVDKERGNLNLDILDMGRYKTPTEYFYRTAMGLKTKTARDAALKSKGLTSNGPYFNSCYTMLDPQRAYPNDSMHAELRLAKYFQEALLEGILSTAGVSAYRQAWDDIKMPYRWGQPQNPVNHKGSMVFSEHGRVAMMNPMVLMHMFTNDDWKRTRSLDGRERAQERDFYFKKGVVSRLSQSFAEESAIGIDCRNQVLHASFGIATAIYLTMQDTLTTGDRAQFQRTIWGMRHILRRIFASASSNEKSFKNYANVPNIHLGLHYEEDLRNYGSIRNCTTMMGEQKHKIFKAHAPHTNSTNNDLQLLKMINTSQTLRFMLDGTFGSLSVAIQTQEIIRGCPTLKGFVAGSQDFSGAVEESDETPVSGEAKLDQAVPDLEDSQSSIQASKIGKPLPVGNIALYTRTKDYSRMISLYKTEYGISLTPGTRIKVKYWGYFAGEPRPHGGKTRRFQIQLGEFVQLLGDEHTTSYYQLQRIMTTTVGSMSRVFFVLQSLERVSKEEIAIAPYPVLKSPADTNNAYNMVGIERIKPVVLHFVKKRDASGPGGENTWWHNPYVPYFL